MGCPMSDSSFMPERQLAFSPMLAQAIGLEEAVLLQHLSELFQHRPVQHSKGRDWMQVERDWLLQTLPFWSSVDLHRVTRSLADKGLILMDSPPLHEADTLVFALNQSSRSQAAQPEPSAAATATAATAPAAKGAGLLGRNWTPSEDLLQLLALNHGISRQFALDQLEDFVLYWCERGEVSHAWENKFRQHVLSCWRQSEQAHAERFTRPEPSLNGHWQPSPDALDILDRADISRAFIDDAVPEFVLYWRERNPREKALNSKFIQHVRRQWNRYQSSLAHDTEPHRIPDSWQPSADVFDILKLSHIDEAFARELLPEFVMYWKDSNQLYKSWNTKFLQHVKYQWAKRNEIDTHDRHQPARGTGRTRDRSLADDLTDRSWAY